jgi:hypothetical protein
MASELDLQLIEGYTGGVNMPLESQDGYVARAVVDEDAGTVNIEYVHPSAVASSAGALGVAGLQTRQSTTFANIGGFALTATEAALLTSIKLRAIASTSTGADACEVRLFSITANAAVSGSTLSFASTTLAEQSTAALTLPSTAAVYTVQMRLATTGSPNTATCLRAIVEGV